MLERIKNLIRGDAYRSSNNPVFPVGRGNRIPVDANGDIVFATCIEILAREVAQVRWNVYGTGNEVAENLMPLYHRAVNVQPYPGINASDFWEYMEKQRLAYGNAFAYVKHGKSIDVQYLIPLDASHMRVFWDNAEIIDGKRRIVYQYEDPVSGKTYAMLPDEVLHFKAYSLNGIIGRSAYSVLRATLSSNAEVESALRTSVANGFSGTIVLTYTSDLSVSKQKELQSQVKELLSNSNATILPLPAGMTASNITNNVKECFETLKDYNAQAISSFFGIPLAMLNIIGGTGMATFSTNQLAQFHNMVINPIIKKYATELTVKLLPQVQVDNGCIFDNANDNFDVLDATSKASVLAAYTGAGILTPNEARRSLQYPASNDPMADRLTQRGGTGALGDSSADEGGQPDA